VIKKTMFITTDSEPTMMNKLNPKEQEVVLATLGECYRRLKAAKMTAREISQDGFNLMFKSVYQTMVKSH
jgi:hypothetical protein